nr:hypothetical protein [Micromonospora sp. DSM 115978]
MTVWAGDLWIAPDDNWPRITAAGCGGSVYPLRLEAHTFPFAAGFFDAVVSVDAYHYFGTDQLYLNYLTPFLCEGGQLGVVVPGFRREPGDGEPPEHLRPFWDPDFATFHSPAWWERLWRSSGRVDVQRADLVPDGAEHWLRWMEVCLATGRTPMPEAAAAEAEMRRVDAG